ncbi:hypothetical protein LCGC14_1737080 [marine sediment metagenome]|uniref:Uncharacterized protein n=1 Tax=marine sediment metagenome TaxID=412755 RepID=A0A0F9K7G0_9ZZZZ
MPTFQHKETQRATVWVSDKRHSPDAIEIKEPQDLPPVEFWKLLLRVPPEIIDQGRIGLDCYLKAFFDKYPKTYFVWIFPSGFPDGIQPTF